MQPLQRMQSTFKMITSATLLLLAVFPVHCNESHFGIDDWTSQDFADHLKKDAKLNVPATAIEACGITGNSLHHVAEMSVSDLSTGACSGLGLNPVQTVQLKESLSRVMNRASSNPVDFWEWRAANRRLFDFWIQPLALNPRTFLIRMRFGNRSTAVGNATAIMFWLTSALFLCLLLYLHLVRRNYLLPFRVHQPRHCRNRHFYVFCAMAFCSVLPNRPNDDSNK
jgi:hypothetical protein